MPTRILRSLLYAGAAVAVLCALATPVSSQSGKPSYDPEVEAVARTIFLELMSPW